MTIQDPVLPKDDSSHFVELFPFRGHLVFEIQVESKCIGKEFLIEYTTDNITWNALDIFSPNKETTLYLDRSGVGKPKRFYRVKLSE